MPEPLTRHDRRRDRTRNQLQDAMLYLLQQHRCEELVVQEITDQADVGRGTFYFHFDSKEDVLWALVEERFPFEGGFAASIIEGSRTPQPEYYLYVNFFRQFEKNKAIFLAALGGNGSQVVASRVRAVLVAGRVQEMKEYDLYRELGHPPEITAQIVVALLISLARWWLENLTSLTDIQMGGILYKTLHHQEPPGGTWQEGASA